MICSFLFIAAQLAVNTVFVTCKDGDVFFNITMPDCYDWRCRGHTPGSMFKPRCGCTERCLLFGDCCYDYYTDIIGIHTVNELESKVDQYRDNLHVSNRFIKNWIDIVDDYGTCTKGQNPSQNEAYIIISKCSKHIEDIDMIRKCEEPSDDFMSEVTVSYIVDGEIQVAFRNIYCAACHGVANDEIKPWRVFVKNDCAPPKLGHDIDRPKLKPYESIKSDCVLVKEKPLLEPALRFVCSTRIGILIGQQPEPTHNPAEHLMCRSYHLASQIEMNDTILTFKNPHCVPDQYQQYVNYTHCEGMPFSKPTASLGPPGGAQLSAGVAVLFNFRDSFSIEIDQNVYVRNRDLCGANFIYDTVVEQCIEVFCPDAQILGDKGCIYDETSWTIVTVPDNLKHSNRSYEIRYNLHTDNQTVENVLGIVERNIKAIENISASVYVQHILQTTTDEGYASLKTSEKFQKHSAASRKDKVDQVALGSGLLHMLRLYFPYVPIYSLVAEQNQSREDDNVSVGVESGNVFSVRVVLQINGRFYPYMQDVLQKLNLYHSHNTTFSIHNTHFRVDCHKKELEYAETNKVLFINESYFGIENNSRILVDIDMTEFRLDFTDGKISFSHMKLCIRNFLNCTMGRYNISEFFILENGTLLHKVSKRILDKTKYLIRGHTVFICIDMLAKRTVQVPTVVSSHELVISMIVESISAVCLYITGILYCGCFGIKRSNSTCIMCLSFTLGTAQALFLIPTMHYAALCQVKAIALHFFWLSAFTWMLIMGFDFAKTFRIDRLQINTLGRYLNVKYALVGYGLPFLFVSVCVCLDKFIAGQPIGYGVGYCWIGNQNAYRYTFAVPVLITVMINIIFFTATVIGMNRAKFKGNTRSIPNRSFLFIYMKLSFIMGFTWIFGFVAGLVNLTVLWYCHIILNGLQGLDIFIVFVLNKSVCEHLRNMKTKATNSINRSGVSNYM